MSYKTELKVIAFMYIYFAEGNMDVYIRPPWFSENTGIVGSNNTRGMNVSQLFFYICVSLLMSSPEVLLTVCKIKKLK
jgi:hypothetical protein